MFILILLRLIKEKKYLNPNNFTTDPKKTKQVKIPQCSNEDLNFSKVFDGNEISIEPIKENLDLPPVIDSKLAKSHKLEFGEIRSLVNWFPDNQEI